MLKNNVKPRGMVTSDSCTSLVSALGRSLSEARMEPSPLWHALMRPGARMLQRLPRGAIAAGYGLGAWWVGAPHRSARTLDPDWMARWLVSHYPVRSYPCVAIGSACGAFADLCGAMAIPLPRNTCTAANAYMPFCASRGRTYGSGACLGKHANCPKPNGDLTLDSPMIWKHSPVKTVIESRACPLRIPRT